MLLVGGIMLLALMGAVEPFKLSLKPTSSQSESYYQMQPLLPPPAPIMQTYYTQHQATWESQPSGVKGEPIRQPLPAAPLPLAQPQALAYVIIRPIQQQQYQYLEPMRYQPAPQPIRQPQGVKGEPIVQVQEQQQIKEEQQPIKGGQEAIKVEEEQQQVIEQTHQPQPQPQPQPAQAFFAKGTGKLLKLKSSLDRLAASAKSKLTLGSSYQVVSEEIVTSPAPVQQQEQQKERDIALTQQEEESVRFAGQQQEEVKGQQQEIVKVQQEITKGQQQEIVKGQQPEIVKEQQQELQQQEKKLPPKQQEETSVKAEDGFRRQSSSRFYAAQKTISASSKGRY